MLLERVIFREHNLLKPDHILAFSLILNGQLPRAAYFYSLDIKQEWKPLHIRIKFLNAAQEELNSLSQQLLKIK